MSGILAIHRPIVHWLSMHNDFRFDRGLWPCDGHECPSYMRAAFCWMDSHARGDAHAVKRICHLNRAVERQSAQGQRLTAAV